MFKKLWQQVEYADIAIGRVKPRWWQGIICMTAAPPRVVLCPIGVNWVIAKVRNLWIATRMPKQAKLDRMLAEAYQNGYSTGYKRGMQCKQSISAL